jgi:SrtB family sortase
MKNLKTLKQKLKQLDTVPLPEKSRIITPEPYSAVTTRVSRFPIYALSAGLAAFALFCGVTLHLLSSDDELFPQQSQQSQQSSQSGYIAEVMTTATMIETTRLPPVAPLSMNLRVGDIDYPVVQADNNEYYLDRNADGEQDRAGWIFADYRNIFLDCQLNGLSDNTILYGHNLVTGGRFSQLKEYYLTANDGSLSFYRENPVIEFHSQPWFVFAVAIFHVQEEYGDYEYWNAIDFADEAEFNHHLKEVMQRSIITTDVDLAYGDKLLTLSTCYFPYGAMSDTRLAIFARKAREADPRIPDVSKATRFQSTPPQEPTECPQPDCGCRCDCDGSSIPCGWFCDNSCIDMDTHRCECGCMWDNCTRPCWLCEEEERMNNHLPAALSIRVINVTRETIHYTIDNDTYLCGGYGMYFHLLKLAENGEWEMFPFKSDDIAFNEIAMMIGPNESHPGQINVEQYFGALPRGTYRICKCYYSPCIADFVSDAFTVS